VIALSEVNDSRLLISQLAAKVGMAPSALRYYEEAGLLTPAARTPAGYRLYEPDAVARINFIQRASALGLKLSEIRLLIESSPRDALSEQSTMHALISRKVDETRSRIEELTSRTADLLRVDANLRLQPPSACCHLGDCGCWFPDPA
jgi:DNA-binding transcriptional MerR regulator